MEIPGHLSTLHFKWQSCRPLNEQWYTLKEGDCDPLQCSTLTPDMVPFDFKSKIWNQMTLGTPTKCIIVTY